MPCEKLLDFLNEKMVEAAWGVVQPVLDVWNALPARDFPNYAAGTWGPAGALRGAPRRTGLRAADYLQWRGAE